MNNTIYGGTTATPTPLVVADQKYDPISANAQSGKAVAEAIAMASLGGELTEEIKEDIADFVLSKLTNVAEVGQ